jgi:ammonia channel protein AmtB
MIVAWMGQFDGATVVLYGILAMMLIATLLPGLMRILRQLCGESYSELSMGHCLWLLATASLAWFAVIFSLCFGPAFDPLAAPSVAEPPMAMEEMMRQAVETEGNTSLFGRGGWIGNLDFALFRTLTPQGNTDRPLFSSRPPTNRIPHTIFQALQLAVFLAGFGSMLIILSTRLTAPAAATAAFAWALLGYAPAVHWLWGDGWLSARGGFDFGGGLLFLLLGSSAAAVAAILPRLPAADDHVAALPGSGSGLTTGVTTALVFAGMVTLSQSMSLVPPAVSAAALFNTLLAASTGCTVAGGIAWLQKDRAVGNDAIRGLLIGLVTASGGCGVYLPASMVVLTLIATTCACGLYNVMDRSNTGRLPAVAVCCLLIPAVFGLVGVGIFGHENYGVTHWNGEFISGLAEGNFEQFQVQLEVVACCGLHCFAVTAVVAALARRVSASRVLKRATDPS